MTTLERLLSTADTICENCDITTYEIRSAHSEYRRLKDFYNVKKSISLSDEVIDGNGWRAISYGDSSIRYRLCGDKPIDIVHYPFTGEYRVHYDGNICKVKTIADVENFLSIVGVHIELRPCDLFG